MGETNNQTEQASANQPSVGAARVSLKPQHSVANIIFKRETIQLQIYDYKYADGEELNKGEEIPTWMRMYFNPVVSLEGIVAKSHWHPSRELGH